MTMLASEAETLVTGDFVELLGESHYRISEYDTMPPFFITVVSSADHWLFVATTGGLTAGRINANHALFPYYTVDRITENAGNTGSKTVVQVHGDTTQLWEPFADRVRTPYRIERALYKNVPGTSLIFEEINVDLGLMIRYAWRTSDQYGIVKTVWLTNQHDQSVKITLTDGIQNVLPAHIDMGTQNEFSVLLDAYKRSELNSASGLGIYALSSRLTDLAEPSESLRANTVWQVGLDNVTHLISSAQIDMIRAGHEATPETDIRGQRGAYFVHTTLELAPQSTRSWHLVGEVHQDNAAVTDLIRQLTSGNDLYTAVEDDIAANRDNLQRIISGADGVQVSGDPLSTRHHFANVLFNVMRGGMFPDGYTLNKADLRAYMDTHDHHLRETQTAFFDSLPEPFSVQTLKQHADAHDNADVKRLCQTYLPLSFSRRHGDPSRPWNRFSIHLKNADGTPRLNYEGNWRDIFQNWEALAFTYPAYLEGMIAVFLNATTIDGYNPYRIMRDGIDWEVPEPENPWANIGYWSDHQIIYLQKLLEAYDRFYPGKLHTLLASRVFTYANVPYRIKPYTDVVADPYNTIDFDADADEAINARVKTHGTDSKLLAHADGTRIYTTLTEKLLNLLLAKLVNFVPEGGIWMNTQRPEWNDANNALVGKGLSVVTTCYLRRFVVYFRDLLADAPEELALSEELHTLLVAVQGGINDYLEGDHPISDAQRRTIMDTLGQAGSDYRWQCYKNGFSGEYVHISKDDLSAFLAQAEDALNRTIHANRREDALYHAYNTLHLSDDTAQIRYLQVMLEGQVAVLSSGLLDSDAVLALLRALRQSALYRADQHSYILYPDRDLPGFIERNTLDEAQIAGLTLVKTLLDRNDNRLIVKSGDGHYHFNGDLRNVRDVRAVLDTLAKQSDLAELVEADSKAITTLFVQNFNHDSFTGRSGSFFAYEGLGSIYWHMVSKLLLAVQENVYRAAETAHAVLPALIDAYYDIRAGLGFNKSPEVYGAFPLDPYSHSPSDRGAKQPGMTGMVKEEILTRLGELGIVIDDGEIVFDPVLLRPDEWTTTETALRYWGVDDIQHALDVPQGAFAFTLCRVPVIVTRGDRIGFTVAMRDGTQKTINANRLDRTLSQHIFAHDGAITQITISCDWDSKS